MGPQRVLQAVGLVTGLLLTSRVALAKHERVAIIDLGPSDPGIRQKLATKRGFEWVKRAVTPREAAAVDHLGLPGIGLIRENRRIYPNEALVPSGTAGLNVESIVLCYQIRTLDKQRLIRNPGTLRETNLRSEIVAALRFQLVITD